ncbi:MAG: hypothetical protein ACPIOQ_64390, partial [Promethearchaeia archaeon]
MPVSGDAHTVHAGRQAQMVYTDWTTLSTFWAVVCTKSETKSDSGQHPTVARRSSASARRYCNIALLHPPPCSSHHPSATAAATLCGSMCTALSKTLLAPSLDP